MSIISVGRQGKEIGDFSFENIRDGLASGFFLPDDYGWYQGLAEWLPLGEIVERLGTLPALPVPPAIPTIPPTFASNTIPSARPITQKVKQNLKPKEGEVTYLLKGARKVRKKKDTPSVPLWQSDPATDKQIAFLKGLGVQTIPPNLTKGEAHNQIDGLLARGQAHHFLSPKQRACLHYYGIDAEKLDYEEAMLWLERVHEKPESFSVHEPWETAKYRLYPTLYPASEKPRKRGCLTLVVVLIICGSAIVFLLLRLAQS